MVTVSHFSRADLAKIFAAAEKSAGDDGIRPDGWDGYVLAFVAAAVGVRVAAHDARAARVFGGDRMTVKSRPQQFPKHFVPRSSRTVWTSIRKGDKR